MKKLGPFRDISVSPLNGQLDLRSQGGAVDFRDFRVVLNMDMTEERKRVRMGGWRKLGSNSVYGFKNQDLHDQPLRCNLYFEEFDEVLSHSSFSGYDYPYFYPDTTTPDVVTSSSGGPYHAYANDYYNTYAYTTVEEQTFIYSAFTGYPYQYVGPFYGAQNTGEPDYWRLSYFYLNYIHREEGEVIPGYGYGDLVATYTSPYNTENAYCGTYPYYWPGCRETITSLYEAVSESGQRRLIAGTKSRLYTLNERSGNWRILADGLGGPYTSASNCECSSARFKMAQLGNFVIFTNNFDPVMFWQFDAGPTGCSSWSADYIPDLLGLNITRAKCVTQWQGFLFVANCEVEGTARSSRIYWSDFNSPLSFVPGGESVAGYSDLGIGEQVIAIAPVGGQLRVYTTRGAEKAIYEVALVGGDQVFSFREVYRGPDGLEYENTLVNIGNAHIYMGESGIFLLGEYDRSPRRTEWIHKASGVIYSGIPTKVLEDFSGLSGFGSINKAVCDHAVGGFDSERKNVWFSWATGSNECPNMSLVLNLVYGSASVVDHGFTAFCSHRPDYSQSLRDFLIERAGCDGDGMMMDKEGEPYADPVAGSVPAYILNPTEDPDLPVHPDSLAARLQDVTLNELCEGCDAESVFVMASADDRCLKEFTPNSYYRESFSDQGWRYDCPYTAPGTYSQEGYYSMMQSDLSDFGVKEEKLIGSVLVDFDAELQSTPSQLNVQVAYGQQPSYNCAMWVNTEPRELACLTEEAIATHEANNTRPDTIPSFPVYRSGVYLAYRFWVSGTGGGSAFNEVILKVRGRQSDWR